MGAAQAGGGNLAYTTSSSKPISRRAIIPPAKRAREGVIRARVRKGKGYQKPNKSEKQFTDEGKTSIIPRNRRSPTTKK